jgi:hypothetical protein
LTLLYIGISAANTKLWELNSVQGDFIYIPGSCTAEAISTLLLNAVETIVPSSCLIATETSDGAKNEQLAASLLVQEGNNIHCTAHLIQLAIDDKLNLKKDTVPLSLARHRAVLRKCHDLVILINNHKAIFTAFSELAEAKKSTDEGTRAFDALVLDNDTRWDSELALLERLVYFDREILQLIQNRALGIPAEVALDRFEFDLAFGMTLALAPLKFFTKFVQNRDIITLAYVPKRIDDVITALAPGRFADQLAARAPGVLDAIETLQTELIDAIKNCFRPIFESNSLALAARYVLPGADVFHFANFVVPQEDIDVIRSNIVDDIVALLPDGIAANLLQGRRVLAEAALTQARAELNMAAADENPLEWWPHRQHLASLFPVVQMLLAIPASSAEDERVFSSASFIQNQRRTRLELDNFRKEQRVRRFLAAGTNIHTQEGRQKRMEQVNLLLRRFSETAEGRRRAQGVAEHQ